MNLNKWNKILQGLSRLVASGMRLLQACFWTSEVPKDFFGLPRTGENYFYLFLNMVWIIQKCKEILCLNFVAKNKYTNDAIIHKHFILKVKHIYVDIVAPQLSD